MKGQTAKTLSRLSAEEQERVWSAKYLVDSSIHPDTHDKVPLPFRMSSFVPTNALVTAGLLLPNPSTASIVLWQWVNQSVNVGINYSNANKSTAMSNWETGVAYTSAVAASVTVAVGLSRVVTSPLLSRMVPFAAVAAAGSLNVFLMRRKEMTDGIAVLDSEGHKIGKSAAAGQLAVAQVALSRVATSLPCLTLPPLVMSLLEG